MPLASRSLMLEAALDVEPDRYCFIHTTQSGHGSGCAAFAANDATAARLQRLFVLGARAAFPRIIYSCSRRFGDEPAGVVPTPLFTSVMLSQTASATTALRPYIEYPPILNASSNRR
jgi:hypothetical protein